MGFYIEPIPRNFLNLSGGTVTGDTVFTQGLTASTFYSGYTSLTEIIVNLVNKEVITSNYFLPLTGGTGGQYYFTGITSAQTLTVEQNITPNQDNTSNLGTRHKRFRSLNTVNGIAVNFTASTKIETPSILLGNREISEYKIILTGDTVLGGGW